MRARAILLVGLLFLGASCGDEDGETVASGDLPLLPIGSGGGGATAAAGSASAMRATAEDAAIAPDGPMPPVEQVTYRLADDITGLGGNAVAYQVPSGFDEDDVKALAGRLGVDRDEIEVYEEAGAPWNYGGDTAVSSSAVASCDAPPPDCAPDAACFTACAPPKEPEPPADLPSREEAERIAARILGEAYKVSVEDVPSPQGWFATGVFTVDGTDVHGLEAGVLVGSKGKVVFANGFLADPEPLGKYPLVGRDEAQQRLDEFGGGGRIAVAADAVGAPEPAMEEPATTSPPSTITRTVEFTSVEVVLEFIPGMCSGDAGYLVPAYEASAAEEQFVIPAVDDRALGEGPASEPAEPCPNGDPGQIEPAVEPDTPVADPTEPVERRPVSPEAEESMRKTLEEQRQRAADSGEADPGR